MSEIISNVVFGFAILCLLWTIIGVVKPQLIIRWAIPEKQTRLRALGFGLSLVMTFGCASYALEPYVSWWAWLLPAFFAMLAMAMGDYFAHTDEFLAERERKKEEHKFRKNQARSETRIKENAEWLDDGFDEKDNWDKEINRFRGNEWLEEWKEELEYSFGKKVPSAKERYLRVQFGGDEGCLYNFRMYAARLRRGEKLCVVPADDYYRQRFDVLAANGVANKFLEFNPELLKALSLPQMREVGRAAGLKSLRVDKAGSLKMLLELPMEALAQAWPAAGVELDSIFQLRRPEDIYAEVKGTE